MDRRLLSASRRFFAHLLLVQLLIIPWARQIASVRVGEDLLPGWQGEVYQPHKVRNASRKAGRRRWVETLSWRPRAFLFHAFLSEEECEHLKGLASPQLSRSMVVGDKGEEKVDPVRTSYSSGLGIGQDEVVRRIEKRIAEWTHLPVNHGEPIEVLRYQNGQKYDSHWDWFDEKDEQDRSKGNRVATVLMYLEGLNPGQGGETSLPLADAINSAHTDIEQGSPCANKMGVALRPEKGDTLLFWDMHPDGNTTDRRALHASCPTTSGTKWTATKWIHNVPY